MVFFMILPAQYGVKKGYILIIKRIISSSMGQSCGVETQQCSGALSHQPHALTRSAVSIRSHPPLPGDHRVVHQLLREMGSTPEVQMHWPV